MSKLEFIDGKFIRNGVVEAPRFGDKEQIELLENLNNIRQAVKTNEYELPNWESITDGFAYTIMFRCTCGRLSLIHPKEIVTDFESSCELTVEHSCACGLKWKGVSEEGFFYNFKTIKQ